ncbi:formate dehydrogenase [Bacillus sp. J14TS2]|uniref:DinB family protein n=1 Tax=Bacillus sp. J14TS2 TaxID=2807188 RepID=UPI001B20A7A3|nr:DinB family protein [Bacillus sp. J14TS2]GIN73044.1 formate dehydrogenase [Bacillus sp. J14TS2]
MGTLRQFAFARSSTIRTLEKITENKWGQQPEGFSNTILWNAGHIFVVTETLLGKSDASYVIQNPKWSEFFASGTRPVDWFEPAASPNTVLDSLRDQKSRIREDFFGKTSQPAAEPFSIGSHLMDTPSSLIQFATWHEGTHLGIIQSLDKVIADA